MATLKEMCNVVDSIPIDKAEGIAPFCLREAWYYLRRAMWNAEENGQCHTDAYGPYYEPCTYWMVGDYIVTYLTEDPYFHVGMLTEEMLDSLIIERA